MRTLIVIPARLASSRLPEKPLIDLAGKPLVQHVYEAALRVEGADDVIIAADDARIVEAARGFGANVVLTSSAHRTGTERVEEVSRGAPDVELFVNLQCDEPLVRPGDVTTLITGMKSDAELQCGTLFHRIGAEEAQRPSVVKLIVGATNRAIYFSRAPIPFPREAGHAEYRKHVGIYAYRRALLGHYAALVPPMEERAESLEQLRLLHTGIPMGAFEIEPSAPGVDTPEDLELVRGILQGYR